VKRRVSLAQFCFCSLDVCCCITNELPTHSRLHGENKVTDRHSRYMIQQPWLPRLAKHIFNQLVGSCCSTKSSTYAPEAHQEHLAIASSSKHFVLRLQAIFSLLPVVCFVVGEALICSRLERNKGRRKKVQNSIITMFVNGKYKKKKVVKVENKC
jgi:hypothetical protein